MINNLTQIINYQFFIIPNEAFEFCINSKIQNNLYMYILTEDNCKFNVVAPEYFDRERIDKGKYTIVLSLKDIQSNTVNTKATFFDKSPNALFFQIGMFEGGFLHESWLYSLKIYTDTSALGLWKRIERNLKKIMKRGGYSVFIPNMSRKLVKRLNYTSEVYKVFKDGIICKPDTGNNILFELGIQNH